MCAIHEDVEVPFAVEEDLTVYGEYPAARH